MSHTPLLASLRRALAAAADLECNADPIVSTSAPTSRRRFLRQAGVATAALATAPWLHGKRRPATAGRVVIVGAGLAGLTCAYRLQQAGVEALVVEAAERIGGRCWTRRGDFADDQIAEHGGELIDQAHTEIRQLAQELRLRLDNVLAAEPNGTEAFFHLGGDYPYREATRDLKVVWKKLHRDLSEAGYPTLFYQSTARGRQLDQMSILDWIDESVPGGRHSRLGRLLDIAYVIEYGAECADQSALNLLYLLGYNSPGQFTLFGASNEKYHVRGGNDQIVSGLAATVMPRIQTGTSLVAVRRTPGGSYGLTVQAGAQVQELPADKVVFALPFSILRDSVDLSQASFSERKLLAIDELRMGSNSKLNVQFANRHWTTLGNNGDTFSDTGYQATWEVSRAQPGTAGILVAYSGGEHADSFGSGTVAGQTAAFLDQLAPVLPGIGAKFNGRATLDHWAGNPLTKGSYAYWRVGQYTTFAGVEGLQEGNAHFCGEHTSIDSQGYLNGAVETGERAAREVLSDWRA